MRNTKLLIEAFYGLLSIVLTLALGGASIYFFNDYNFFLAVVFLIWTMFRLFGYRLNRFVRGFGDKINSMQIERQCNVEIKINISIEEVLKHVEVGNLFDRLKKNEIVNGNKEEWVNQLIQNYKKIFDKKMPLEEVTFNIKNNILWKNGNIDFSDAVYHEVYIPYDYNQWNEEDSVFLSAKSSFGLTIRVFIVNGIIKLQIGEFSENHSPEATKKGLSTYYKTHETIASFPLMYFYCRHNIPANYLNFSMYAIDSYYKFLKHEKNDFMKDWEGIEKEIRDYNYVCADEYVPERGRFAKIVNEFDKKREKILKDNDFKEVFPRMDSSYDYFDYWRDNSIYLMNELMMICVVDHNEYHEKRKEFLYTDYVEDRPYF